MRSFRLLKEPAGARAGARLGAGVGYLVVTLLCLAVGWIVNRLAGRPVFNGGLVAVAVVGLVVAARLVVLALGGVRAGLAEALGTMVGEGAIALAIGGIAWRRFHRQKAAWRAGKPVVADPRPTP